MNNNKLKPGAVLAGGYGKNKQVVVPFAAAPPGAVAVYSPALNCVTVYCQPEKYNLVVIENGGDLFNAMEEHAQYMIEQARRVIAFAQGMRNGAALVEFPPGVDVRYVDYEAEPVPKNRVSFAPVD